MFTYPWMKIVISRYLWKGHEPEYREGRDGYLDTKQQTFIISGWEKNDLGNFLKLKIWLIEVFHDTGAFMSFGENQKETRAV